MLGGHSIPENAPVPQDPPLQAQWHSEPERDCWGKEVVVVAAAAVVAVVVVVVAVVAVVVVVGRERKMRRWLRTVADLSYFETSLCIAFGSRRLIQTFSFFQSKRSRFFFNPNVLFFF